MDIIWHFLHPKHPIKVGSSSGGNPHPLKREAEVDHSQAVKKVRKEPRVVFLSSFNVTHLPFSVEMKLRKNQRYELVLLFSFNIPDF